MRQRTSLVPTVTGQAGLIDQHSVGIAEFFGRLNINSRNSPRPPSSDSYAKPAPQSRRRRSGRKPKRQPGDPGRHRAQRSHPDVTVVHPPSSCGDFGNGLSDVEVTATVVRQVFDLPPVALFCTSTNLSEGVVAAVLWRPESSHPKRPRPVATAQPSGPACCYQVTHQHIPVARIAELCETPSARQLQLRRPSRCSKRALRSSTGSSPA